MTKSLKLALVTTVTALALSVNTSCTPGEAAVVGGIAGAAIGAAAASGNRNRGNFHHGGWNNHPGNFGPRGGGGWNRGGWNGGRGGQCW